MTQSLFCLECQAVVGEIVATGEGDRGAGTLTCQACAQHGGGYPGGSAEAPADDWPIGRTVRSRRG